MPSFKLFLIVLGATPLGRHIEQHDVVFAVGESIKDCFVQIRRHWPIPSLHIDSYAAIEEVDGYRVSISEKPLTSPLQLYFVNLGGYKPNDLEEYHKKLVIAASSLFEAKEKAKEDIFYSEGLQKGPARSHLDDKMAIDEILLINEKIPKEYSILLTEDSTSSFLNNIIVPGYYPLPLK